MDSSDFRLVSLASEYFDKSRDKFQFESNLSRVIAISYAFDVLIFGFCLVLLFWIVIGLSSWYVSYEYIKGRKDLHDGKEYKIYDCHGDKFLVALLDGKVVGTILYAGNLTDHKKL